MPRRKFPFYLLVACILSAVFANPVAAQYSITANIIDIAQICYITGEVKDAAGNPVHPAYVTFACGSVQTKVRTITGGYYINPAPPCNDYTITATAPGVSASAVSGIQVSEGELYPLDFSFDPAASLESAVGSLQVAAGLATPAMPADHNGDGNIGVADAIYNLQYLAQLRGGAGTQSVSWLAMDTPVSVRLSRDTDDDDEDDWYQDTFTDADGYLEIEGLESGSYTLTAMNADNTQAVGVTNIKVAGRNVHLKTIRMKPVGQISGKVLLEGAADHSDTQVYVPGSSYTAYAAADGTFLTDQVPEGTYTLKAKKENFGTILAPDVAVASAQVSTLETITLPSVTGDVSGTVWLQGEVDYTGILVTLRKDAGRTYLAATNASGDYLFEDVPVGIYTLSASMSGFVGTSSTLTVETGTNPQAPKNLLIDSTKGTLTGTVTLADATKHAGVLISLAGTGYSAVSDDSGQYTLEDVPQGAYTVFINVDGYSAKRFENVQIQTGETTELNASLALQRSAIGQEAAGSIVGNALYIDATDHSGVSVKVEGAAIPLAGTDANGGFMIESVLPGTYTLSFTQANYKTVHVAGVTVAPWDASFVEDIEMIPPVGRITGTVLLEGETSHDNVTVSVDGTSITAQTLADGSFVLENVQEGTVNISAYKAGFNTAHLENVSVVAGQTTILEETLLLTTPPDPPSGVSAVQASGSSVTLSWTESPSPDVAGYNVYYGTASDAISTKANAAPVDGRNVEVTGLEKGVTYYFAVQAVDNDGLVSPPAPADGSLTAVIHPSWEASVLEGSYQINLPSDIALTLDGNTGYVSSKANACLLKRDFNAATPAVVDQVNITGTSPLPTQMAVNPISGKLYVVDNNQGKLFVLDPATDAFTDSVDVGAFPTNVIVSPDGSKIYVCSVGTDVVTVIDTATLTVEATVSLNGEDADPVSMALANGKLYVAGKYTYKAYVIDAASHAVVDTIAIGAGAYDTAARIDGAYVYISHDTPDGKVSVIDTATDRLVSSITIRNDGETTNKNSKGLAVSGNVLFVVNWGDSTVTIIDTQHNAKLLLDSPINSGGNGPVDLTITSDGSRLYILHAIEGAVEILGY